MRFTVRFRRKVRKLCSFVVISILVFIFYNSVSIQNAEEQVENWGYNSTRDTNHYVHLMPRILPNHLCNNHYLLVVMVHSKPSNFKVRRSIRNSWGDRDRIYDTFFSKVVFFFLLGEVRDFSLQYAISQESKRFDDIIQERFVDSSKNSTIKSVMMLKIATIYCNQCEYLLKVNDDVLANLDNIVKMVRDNRPAEFLMGELICDAKPDRNPRSKWYAPFYLYPEATYPNYLSKGAYVMSMEVAKKLYQVVLKTPLFHIEDIYITGICAKKVNIEPQHNDLFSKRKIQFSRDKCLLRQLHAIHNVNSESMRIIHYVLMHRFSENCSKTEEFSSARWIFNSVLKVKDNPFSYRKTCK